MGLKLAVAYILLMVFVTYRDIKQQDIHVLALVPATEQQQEEQFQFEFCQSDQQNRSLIAHKNHQLHLMDISSSVNQQLKSCDFVLLAIFILILGHDLVSCSPASPDSARLQKNQHSDKSISTLANKLQRRQRKFVEPSKFPKIEGWNERWVQIRKIKSAAKLSNLTRGGLHHLCKYSRSTSVSACYLWKMDPLTMLGLMTICNKQKYCVVHRNNNTASKSLAKTSLDTLPIFLQTKKPLVAYYEDAIYRQDVSQFSPCVVTDDLPLSRDIYHAGCKL